MNDTQLAITGTPQLITTLDDMDRVAKSISGSGMFGITKPEQAITLMLICQAEGLNPIAALRRYHLIENKPSMRADAMHGEFEARGARIIWHVRSDSVVAGTAFKDGASIDDAARERATKRFELLWQLECLQDENKRGKLFLDIAKLSREGEETLIRTYADAEAKGLTEGAKGTKANWSTSPRQMLTARFVTEIVRLLDPGLIAGIISDIEAQDIARREQHERQRLTNTQEISQDDVPAILEIIAQHDAELATDLPDARRKTVQGLRMDLVCKLGDIGVKPPAEPEAPAPTVGGQPAKVVDATVLPPEPTATKQPAARQQRAQRPAPTPTTAPEDDLNMRPEQGLETPWREFICLRGPSPGIMNGHTLEDIFVTGRMKPDSVAKLEKLVGWFVGMAIPTSSDAHDKILWAKVQQAAEHIRAVLTAGTPATPASPQTAPTPEKPAQQPASPTRWQDYTITSKSPDWNGKKLGDIAPDDIKRLKSEYLDMIDMARATLAQKSLVANVTLAMRDLGLDKDAETVIARSGEEPPHTARLLGAITGKKWSPEIFLTVCKLNTWVDEGHRTINDITEIEMAALTSEWAEVAVAMDKAHKGE